SVLSALLATVLLNPRVAWWMEHHRRLRLLCGKAGWILEHGWRHFLGLRIARCHTELRQGMELVAQDSRLWPAGSGGGAPPPGVLPWPDDVDMWICGPSVVVRYQAAEARFMIGPWREWHLVLDRTASAVRALRRRTVVLRDDRRLRRHLPAAAARNLAGWL